MTLTLERCENCNGQTPDRENGLCHNCRPQLTADQYAALQAFAAALEVTAARFRTARTRSDADAAFAVVDALVDDQMAMRAEKAAAGAS